MIILPPIENNFVTEMEKANIPPLKFEPILKSTIWGGEKIAKLKGIESDRHKIGESWEISGVAGNESVVSNGPDAGLTLSQMIDKYKGLLTGDKIYSKFGNKFPLLIKIIDATDDLSLQVHPNDELAMRRHNSLGKTEMWYILETEPDALICSGLSRSITPNEYVEKVADHSLMDIVAHHISHPGDVFFLPAGRVHSIGAGNLLIEVQETSDVTYRIYDFGRVDAKTGKPRELHVDLAKDAIDYTVYPSYITKPSVELDGITKLVTCDHFTVYRVKVDGEKKLYPDIKSFFTMTCYEGNLTVTDDRGNSVSLKAGESALIPAMATSVTITGNGTSIHAYI